MERPRGAVAVALLAVLLTLTAAVLATGPWTRPLVSFDSGSLWSASATAALGGAGVLLGGVVVAVAQGARRPSGWSTRLSAAGCLLAVLGVVGVLAGVHRLPGQALVIAPVTVAIGQFTVGPAQTPSSQPLDFAPTAVFVVVVGLVVVTVVGALLRVRRADLDTAGATRPVVVVAGLGAVVLVLGASLLPWSIGADLGGRSLWRSSPELAVAVGVLLVAAVVTVVLVRRSRPAPAVAALVAVLAGLAGAVVVVSRLAVSGRGDFAWYGSTSALLVRAPSAPPSDAALAASQATVYAGVGLLVLAALAAVSLAGLRGGTTNVPDRPLSDS